MSKFTYLESPMTIRGKVYRNRLIAAPTLFAHSVFFLPEIAENVYRMVENRAKGGFAAVSTGELLSLIHILEANSSLLSMPSVEK